MKVDGAEIAAGGFASVRMGVLMECNSNPSSKSVCIKAIKVTTKDQKEERGNIEKVDGSLSLVTGTLTRLMAARRSTGRSPFGCD